MLFFCYKLFIGNAIIVSQMLGTCIGVSRGVYGLQFRWRHVGLMLCRYLLNDTMSSPFNAAVCRKCGLPLCQEFDSAVRIHVGLVGCSSIVLLVGEIHDRYPLPILPIPLTPNTSLLFLPHPHPPLIHHLLPHRLLSSHLRPRSGFWRVTPQASFCILHCRGRISAHFGFGEKENSNRALRTCMI